jgi:hypothetical protein
MARRQTKPPALDQGRPRQRQDDAALRHYQRNKQRKGVNRAIVVLLLPGHRQAHQQCDGRAPRPHLLTSYTTTIAYLACTREL